MRYQRRVAKVRAWTGQAGGGSKFSPKSRKRLGRKGVLERIEHIMVFDTETSVDKEQRFNFGSAVYMAIGNDGKFHEVVEYLIYADDLPERDPVGYATLQDYILRGHSERRGKHAPSDRMTIYDIQSQGFPEGYDGSNIQEYGLWGGYPREEFGNEYSTRVDYLAAIKANVERQPASDIELISQNEFAERLNRAAYPRDEWKANKPATIVGFNLPFDLSRIAHGVAQSRGKYAGGFTFGLRDGNSGQIRAVKRGIKGAMFSYTGGKKDVDYFTDASTLTFGLTSKSHSLASAGAAFGVEQRKSEATDGHGRITLDYIHYCRQDVRATADLYVALVKELDRHPIDLSDSKVFSPASIAKAYLRAMGVPEPLKNNPKFPDSILGYSMATFYGGRAEAHIRKVPVPVEHVDVTSMYPTVNALMGLWELLTHERIRVWEETAEVQSLVENITIDDLFNPDRWTEFRGIVQVQPTGDLLPLRTRYGNGGSETIGISHVTSDEPMWWTLPDVINAKINGDKIPQIVRAWRFYPEGKQLDTLKPVDLRGQVRIDPRQDDFFTAVIERRLAIKSERDCDCGICDRCRNVLFLKILANAGSYGIFVEMNREEDKQESEETIYGALSDSWPATVRKPETPGQYCFPPIGTLITGAARLVLGMLEKLVTDAGGTWAMCDTDSMAIVASENKGWIAPEPSLPPRPVIEGDPGAIPVLPYSVVEDIRKRFDALSPYDESKTGPVPILKRERPEDLNGPQVYCYAISAKRYVEFEIAEDDGLRIVENKEHGLGQYMNPEDPSKKEERGQREWIRDIWQHIILSDAGLNPPQPEWFSRPAMSRVSVATWSMYHNLRRWNEGREYADQIKPYGFMMAPVVASMVRKMVDPDFRLIGPYSTKSDEWQNIEFQNVHDPEGSSYRIVTDLPAELEAVDGYPVVRVQSYADVVSSYSVHPEEKFADIEGKPCRRTTRGVLQRHHVKVVAWEHQGKETNDLEERETNTVIEAGSVVAEYGTGRDDFQRFVIPVLQRVSPGSRQLAELVEREGENISSRQLRSILKGESKPRPELRGVLTSIAVRRALDSFGPTLPVPKWKSEAIARREWREVLSAWVDTFAA